MNLNVNRNAGNLAAAVGISAVLTAGYSWLEVLLGWCVGAILCWGREIPSKCRRDRMPWIQPFIGTLLVAGAAQAAEQAFLGNYERKPVALFYSN